MLKRVRVLGLLLIAALLPSLAACGAAKDMLFGRPLEGINLAIIIGSGRANSYWLTNADFDLIEEQLRRAFTATESGSFGTTTYGAKANVWVIISDGDPKAIEFRRSLSVSGAANGTDRDAEIDKLIVGIMSDLRNRNFTKARHIEADLFGALHVAADLLNQASQGKGGTSENYLLIFDNGISTQGRIDMANGIDIQAVNLSASDASPFEDIIGPLETLGLLPDLKHVNVVFHGLGGSAAYPQEIPADSNIFRGQLMGLWEEILFASGANIQSIQWGVRGTVSNLYFEPNPHIEEMNFLFVTLVIFHDVDPFGNLGRSQAPWERLVTVGDSPEAEDECAFTNGGLDLLHEWLGFKGNSCDFYNDDRGLEIIEYAATQIRPFLEKNPNSVVHIVGSEARVRLDVDNSGYISRIRAEKVANILIEHFGIPERNIVTIGANTTEFPWRNAQEFPLPERVWNDANAALNRVVAIIPDTSDRFVYLQEAGFVE